MLTILMVGQAQITPIIRNRAKLLKLVCKLAQVKAAKHKVIRSRILKAYLALSMMINSLVMRQTTILSVLMVMILLSLQKAVTSFMAAEAVMIQSITARLRLVSLLICMIIRQRAYQKVMVKAIS